MGNKQTIKENTNLKLLVDALRNQRIDNFMQILSCVDDIDGYYEGMTLMHYIVIYSHNITHKNLQEICNSISIKLKNNIKSYVNNVNNIARSANISFTQRIDGDITDIHLTYAEEMKTTTIIHYDLDKFNPYSSNNTKIPITKTICKVKGLDVLSLCFLLKNELKYNNDIFTKFDYIIDFVKKINNESLSYDGTSQSPPPYVS